MLKGTQITQTGSIYAKISETKQECHLLEDITSLPLICKISIICTQKLLNQKRKLIAS